MEKKQVCVMFGGVSAEHEVSVISGLQVLENIDKDKYQPFAVYHTKNGHFSYYPGLIKRKDFKKIKPVSVQFGKDTRGTFFVTEGLLPQKQYLDCVYLAFHGGNGESGPIQGFLEVLGVPFTSSTLEASVITMNKSLTHQVLRENGLPVVKSISLLSREIIADSQKLAEKIIETLGLPVIVKPVHLGSSIGISIVRSSVELEKKLLEAAYIDTEILVEELLTDFTEYNCSVRSIDGKVETSEIERPISHDEILSFADKYQRGGNKKGGSGMASLQRELPAKMSEELQTRLEETAKKVFIACRCKGMVRIDFMVKKDGQVFVTEINPIPGSMSFYLWEASGITFSQQITDLIEQGIKDYEVLKSKKIDYETDIVEKFVA